MEHSQACGGVRKLAQRLSEAKLLNQQERGEQLSIHPLQGRNNRSRKLTTVPKSSDPGVTYRSVGHSKAATSPSSPPQHG